MLDDMAITTHVLKLAQWSDDRLRKISRRKRIFHFCKQCIKKVFGEFVPKKYYKFDGNLFCHFDMMTAATAVILMHFSS